MLAIHPETDGIWPIQSYSWFCLATGQTTQKDVLQRAGGPKHGHTWPR